MSKLVSNISSDYFEASGRITGRNTTMVYVEGYDDISFWRNIFDDYESDTWTFHVTTPVRRDLAKGKKVVMQMIPKAGRNLFLCVDSDFDYLFGDLTEESRAVNHSPYLFQTYVYSIENYMCYAPSLASVCVHATKNDDRIFDFVEFMAEYSRIIYPLFLWYALSARKDSPTMFPLSDFKAAVHIGFLDPADNGAATLKWLERNVDKRVAMLTKKHAKWVPDMREFEREIRLRGVDETNVYLFIQGHTLLDNVVKVILARVCEQLRQRQMGVIMGSQRQGVTLKNEISNYTNSLRDILELVRDNVGYKRSPFYAKLKTSLEKYIK